jgi:hypothetical protein
MKVGDVREILAFSLSAWEREYGARGQTTDGRGQMTADSGQLRLRVTCLRRH